jgi:DNA-binding transcriptional MerR regulator
VTQPLAQPRLRIADLAERSGVSVATIKYYIREGLLPPAPVKTGRTMGYYDEPYLERLQLIRKLREDHLPVRVIREILAEAGSGPLGAEAAARLARVGPGVLQRLDTGGARLSREEVVDRFGASEELALLEEMGLVGEGGTFSQDDVALLEAMRVAEGMGVTRELFPVEGLGHYVELLGELARREVRTFVKHTGGIPAAELEALAERALTVSEPIVNQIRRKLILRVLRAELNSPGVVEEDKT